MPIRKLNGSHRMSLQNLMPKSGNKIEKVLSDVIVLFWDVYVSDSKIFITVTDNYSWYSLVWVWSKSQTRLIWLSKQFLCSRHGTGIIGHLLNYNTSSVMWVQKDRGSGQKKTFFNEWLVERNFSKKSTGLYSRESIGKAEKRKCTVSAMARSMWLSISK